MPRSVVVICQDPAVSGAIRSPFARNSAITSGSAKNSRFSEPIRPVTTVSPSPDDGLYSTANKTPPSSTNAASTLPTRLMANASPSTSRCRHAPRDPIPDPKRPAGAGAGADAGVNRR